MVFYPRSATTESNFDVKASLRQSRISSLLGLLKGERWRYTGAIVAIILSALFNTLSLLLIQYLVDEVLTEGNPAIVSTLLWVAVAFVALAAFRSITAFFSGSLSARTAESVALRLRDFAFDHLQRLSFSFHDREQTGELIQRVTSDVDTIRALFSDQVVGIFRIVALFAINWVAILALNWQLGLLSVLIVPFVMASSVFFFRRISKAWDSFQEQEAVLSNTLQENLTGVRVVKAFARQEFEIERFERENTERFRRGIYFIMHHAVYWPIVDFLTGAQLAAGYLIGALLTISGDMTLGGLVAYLILVRYTLFPIRDLGRIIVQVSMSLVSFDRVRKILDEDWEPLGEDQSAPVSEISGSITFENVTFSYESDKHVLSNISLNIDAGQTVAFIGSTGSGKTSIINLIPRFYNYDSGHICLDGIELTEYPRQYLRQHIGIIEQEPFLFSRSIRENIMYGVHRDVTEEQMHDIARAAAVHDVIMSFPQQYDTLVGERGVTLSGGQKQRVALARTLLKDPRILILDDATSSVDTQTDYDIRQALDRLMAGRTSIIVAHRIQSVMDADTIFVLEEGRIVQQGTHDELVAQEGTYRNIYSIQTSIEEELEQELAYVG